MSSVVYPSSITPACSSGVGYTVWLSNGTHYTFVIGVNATYFPSNFVVGYTVIDYILFIAALFLAGFAVFAVATGRVLGTTRLAVFVVVSIAVATVGALLAANPLRPITIQCGSASYSVLSYDPTATLGTPTALITVVALVILVAQQLIARWGV